MQHSGYGSPGTNVSPLSGDLVSVVNQCYQCAKCSAGCPVAADMDLLPHQMVRLAVLGDIDPIVASRSIWLCLTCHTCGARCPNGIDVPALLDPIRHRVIRDEAPVREPRIPAFHTTFLQNVRMFGRVQELVLIGMYKWKTKTFFEDMQLGLQMFRKGKIHLLPRRASNVGEVKEVFGQSSMK